MAARVITVAQQKGGAGKTTLAAHLGVCWAGQGRRVALIDIDPQGSLTTWYRLRNGHGTSAITHCAVSGWRAASEVDRLRRDHDVVVIDSPPHAETEAKIAIRAAELLVVPVQLSPMDLWATRPTLQIAEGERRPWLLVLNRVPPRGSLSDVIRHKIAEQRLPVAGASLGNRTLFASSLMDGMGVTEAAPSSIAAAEIVALADELALRLGLWPAPHHS
ncbi:MAG TPA: ParA family partition ATPase [Candidatus Cybelea sp.]|nr:ParA family partition ATPase [Candidatus Cybelea sp.]